MDDFLLFAIIGGLGVAAMSGPLGCIILWQRMAYFGAALSHGALLGIALGFFLEIHPTIAILVMSLVISTILLAMEHLRHLTSDTILGILAHSSLALGILALGLLPNLRVDLTSYLFGDILTIQLADILQIYGGGAIVLIILSLIWKPLLSLTTQRELALTDGVNEKRIRLILLSLMSIVIAVSLQVIGALLIVSLLIIPAASARRFSRSPEQMAIGASLLGMIAIIIGLSASFNFDTPAGPSIVAVSTLLFLATLLMPQR